MADRVIQRNDRATLFLSTVQNGQLFVSYNNDANYIILKTK